jgi:hypothetical protein
MQSSVCATKDRTNQTVRTDSCGRADCRRISLFAARLQTSEIRLKWRSQVPFFERAVTLLSEDEFMWERQTPQHIGGNQFHVGDCRIWVEIYYLDSPTSYREYLTGCTPQRSDGERPCGQSELRMLDESPSRLAALLHLTMSGIRSISGLFFPPRNRAKKFP